MKKMVFQELRQTISLGDPQFVTFVIENVSRFRDYVLRIFAKTGCVEELISITEDANELVFDDSVICVENPLILEINSKQNINALSRIVKRSYLDDLKEAVQLIEDALTNAVGKIRLDFGVELTSEVDLKAEDVFKIANIRFEEESASSIERLLRFLCVQNELHGNDVAVILSLRSYFTDEEIEQLVRETRYRGISIIDIENHNPKSFISDEKRLIIDEDLCFF